MSTLHLVYGQRTASNPHARNWASFPLPSPRLGNRALRRKLRSMARQGGLL